MSSCPVVGSLISATGWTGSRFTFITAQVCPVHDASTGSDRPGPQLHSARRLLTGSSAMYDPGSGSAVPASWSQRVPFHCHVVSSAPSGDTGVEQHPSAISDFVTGSYAIGRSKALGA